MAVGKKVISAFSGPADVNSFDMINHVPSSQTIKQKKSAEREELERLYLSVRNIREGKPAITTLKEAFASVSSGHPNDWLLTVEIAEIANLQGNEDLLEKTLLHLENIKIKRPEVAHLITNGIELIMRENETV